MAIISPQSLFPNMTPMSTPMPSMWEARQQLNMTDEAYNQIAQANRLNAIQEQQQALQLQNSQLNQPVEAMQRQMQMGQMGGQIQRQPFENAAATEQARLQSDPQFQQSKFSVMLRENQDKLKDSDLKRFNEEMGHAVSAFGPMMDAFRMGDLSGVRDEYKNGIDYLKKAGVDTKGFADSNGEDPQGNGIAKAKSLYQQAVMNAPTVRKIIETRTAHENDLEKIRLQGKNQENIANIRASAVADKPVTNPKAIVAQIIDKYRKDPESVSPEEAGILKEELETNYAKYNQSGNDQLWAAAEKAVREEEKKSGGGNTGRGLKVREKYNQLLQSEIQRNFPTLYKKQERTIIPTGPRTVDQILNQPR